MPRGIEVGGWAAAWLLHTNLRKRLVGGRGLGDGGAREGPGVEGPPTEGKASGWERWGLGADRKGRGVAGVGGERTC